MLAAWKKQGLSDYQINEKLVAFNLDKEPLNIEPGVKLLPGESIQTQSWFHYGDWARVVKKRPKPKPIGNFAQLDAFDLEVPGVYKVRAVYNHRLTPEITRIVGKLPSHPEEVLVHTQWIKVTVER